jgi:hypothetical protein
MSAVIMAHPSRERWVPQLASKVGADVVWDGGWNDRHRTGFEAMKAYDRKDRWHLVVQDDAIVCEDLLETVDNVMRVAGDRVVCLYVGKLRPKRMLASSAVEVALSRGDCFIEGPGPWWGVGIVFPTSVLPDLIGWYDGHPEVQNYDRRNEKACQALNVDCWYTVPSLVDHRTDDNPSLHRGRPSAGRRAHVFVGEDVSGAGMDWTGGVLSIDDPQVNEWRFSHGLRAGGVSDLSGFEVGDWLTFVRGSEVRRRVKAGSALCLRMAADPAWRLEGKDDVR